MKPNMKDDWQLQEAKAKFSQVLDQCLQNGPQPVSRYGARVAYIISAADYELMTRPAKKVDLQARHRRMKKRFGNKIFKTNLVLEDREGGR